MEYQYLLFFDSHHLQPSHNVHLAYGPVERLGTMVEPDTPADRSGASVYLGPVVHLDNGSYRMYYHTYGFKGRCPRILVATSDDGLSWTKPSLGQELIEGRDTNLLHIEGLHDQCLVRPSVMQITHNQWRMYAWGRRNGTGTYGMIAAESNNGLNWRVLYDSRLLLFHPSSLGDWARCVGQMPEETPATETTGRSGLELKRLRSGDVATVYGTEAAGYEIFHTWDFCRDLPDASRPIGSRCIVRRTSQGGMVWGNPRLVLWPDEMDPSGMQLSHLAVHDYAGWRIGLLGHYLAKDREGALGLELAFSRRGFDWMRPLRGAWFTPNAGERGIFPASGFTETDHHWLLYYSDGSAPQIEHSQDAEDEMRPTSISAVRISRHRLVGVAAGNEVGGFTTQPIFPSKQTLSVNANIRGRLRAELCDIYGRALQGYSLDACDPITGDSEQHILHWGGHTASRFRYDPIRLRFELQDGEVYAVGF